MKVYREVSGVYDFEFWSGAYDTVKKVIEADKENEFWDFIEEYFDGYDSISDVDLNDFVWFESEYIYEHIGLTENGELPEDDEDEPEDDEDDEDMED